MCCLEARAANFNLNLMSGPSRRAPTYSGKHFVLSFAHRHVYLEFGVGTANLLSFDSFYILNRVLKIHFFNFFRLYDNKILILKWKNS